MPLDLEQIRRIARLARIAVSDDEAQAAAGKLNSLLGLIEQMQAVDTTGIEPMSHAMDLVQRLREDKAVEPDVRSKPRRTRIVLVSALVAAFAAILLAFLREQAEKAKNDPQQAKRMARLKEYLLPGRKT